MVPKWQEGPFAHPCQIWPSVPLLLARTQNILTSFTAAYSTERIYGLKFRKQIQAYTVRMAPPMGFLMSQGSSKRAIKYKILFVALSSSHSPPFSTYPAWIFGSNPPLAPAWIRREEKRKYSAAFVARGRKSFISFLPLAFCNLYQQRAMPILASVEADRVAEFPPVSILRTNQASLNERHAIPGSWLAKLLFPLRVNGHCPAVISSVGPAF